MCSFNPCLPYPSYIKNIWPFSYRQSLCSCCLLTTWKCVPQLDLLLCARRNGLATTYTRYFALRMQLPPAPQSSFSFHLGCVYAQKQKTKQNIQLRIHKTPVVHQALTTHTDYVYCYPFTLADNIV